MEFYISYNRTAVTSLGTVSIMMIRHYLPDLIHQYGRDWAPALGNNDQALNRIRVHYPWIREPSLYVSVHPLPCQLVLLTASLERPIPETYYLALSQSCMTNGACPPPEVWGRRVCLIVGTYEWFETRISMVSYPAVSLP